MGLGYCLDGMGGCRCRVSIFGWTSQLRVFGKCIMRWIRERIR